MIIYQCFFNLHDCTFKIFVKFWKILRKTRTSTVFFSFLQPRSSNLQKKIRSWVFSCEFSEVFELLNRASPDAFNLINIRSEAAAEERSLKKLLWKISQKFTRSFTKLFRITIQLVLSGEKKNRAWPVEYILAKAVVKRQSYYHLVLSSYQLAGLYIVKIRFLIVLRLCLFSQLMILRFFVTET